MGEGGQATSLLCPNPYPSSGSSRNSEEKPLPHPGLIPFLGGDPAQPHWPPCWHSPPPGHSLPLDRLSACNSFAQIPTCLSPSPPWFKLQCQLLSEDSLTSLSQITHLPHTLPTM